MMEEAFLAVMLGIVLIGAPTGFVVSGESIDSDSLLLRVSLEKGEMVSKTLSITNSKDGIDLDVSGDVVLSPEENNFLVRVRGVDGVSLSENSFYLDVGEKKVLDITFDSKGLEEGVYIGSVFIKSDDRDRTLPVIFEVESKNKDFDLNLDLPVSYSKIRQGDEIVVNMDLFDLAFLGTTNTDLEYQISNIEGNVLILENENVVVSGKTRITKTIDFPEDVSPGEYVFSASITANGKEASSAFYFKISERGLDIFDGSGISLNTLLIVLILSLVIIFLVIYLLRDKNSLIRELRNYNYLELQHRKELLHVKEQEAKKKGSTKYKEFRRSENKDLKVLKAKQEKRVSSFKSLQKKGDRKAMFRKLNEWGKKGYNTGDLKSRVKSPSVREMQKQLTKWKKKYKTEEYKKKK